MASPSWPPPPTYVPPTPQFRPLSLGEVLDRTFTLYRKNFWLIAGISAISGAVQLAGQFLQLLGNHILLHRSAALLGTFSLIMSIIVTVIFWLSASVTQAATVYAVSELQLGRTTTVADSLRVITADRWWRFPLIGLRQLWSLGWPVLAVFVPIFALAARSGNTRNPAVFAASFFLFLPAFAIGVFFFLKIALAIPVAVVEQLLVNPSIRRAKLLSPGAKGPLVILYLLLGALYMAAGGIIGALGMFFLFFRHGIHDVPDPAGTPMLIFQAITLVFTFLIHTMMIPVILVGTAVVYFNQRVNLEGFDVLLMLGQEQALNPIAAYAPPPVPQNPATLDFTYAQPLPEPPAQPIDHGLEPPPPHDATEL